jgi:hypothetical protein
MQNVHCGMLVVKLAAYSFADSVTHIGDAVARERGGTLQRRRSTAGGAERSETWSLRQPLMASTRRMMMLAARVMIIVGGWLRKKSQS